MRSWLKTKIVGGCFLASLTLVAILLAGCSPGKPKTKTATQALEEQNRRTQWRRETFVGEYERAGSKDPRWDEEAKAALEAFALMDVNDTEQARKDSRLVARHAAAAAGMGCNDPLMRYIDLRFNRGDGRRSNEELRQAYREVAAALSGSGYCEIRKFYGCLNVALALKSLDESYDVINPLRREAMGHLKAALESKEKMPPSETLAACTALLEATQANATQFPDAYAAMEAPLMKNYGDTAVPYVVKGHYYIEYAWKARGNGYADSVTKEGWKLFGERLKIAQAALEKAWKIDPAEPAAPTRMITVALGLQLPRAEMEVWFQRAMKADPRNRVACEKKLHFLKPQWYGSFADMIAFGHECMTNENWGGEVTTMLVDAHQGVADISGERGDYWKRPGVWTDVRGAFEEFFRRNPEATRLHYNFALYAWRCEDWKVLNEQVALLDEPIDYGYFGGKESFETMRGYAKEYLKANADAGAKK